MKPKSRSIRYDNMKSAMAEESVIAMVCKSPSVFSQLTKLKPEQFSSPLLGRVYGQLQDRYANGLEVSPTVLEELDGEEMSHITGILQRNPGPVNEVALTDCVTTISEEHRKRQASGNDGLMAWRNQLIERKGMG